MHTSKTVSRWQNGYHIDRPSNSSGPHFSARYALRNARICSDVFMHIIRPPSSKCPNLNHLCYKMKSLTFHMKNSPHHFTMPSNLDLWGGPKDYLRKRLTVTTLFCIFFSLFVFTSRCQSMIKGWCRHSRLPGFHCPDAQRKGFTILFYFILFHFFFSITHGNCMYS